MKEKSKKGVTSPRFADLPAATRRLAATRIVGQIRRFGAFGAFKRSGYDVVKVGNGQVENRPWISAETGGEDKILTQGERNRLISMSRNLSRNSEQLEGLLHQFEVNVVGTEGGKAIFSFGEGYEREEEELREAFAEWARSCEFFDDLSLQRLLKLALRTQIVGGNVVFAFDDDLVEDSGKIIAFEPDCIGNVAESEFKALFPNLTQTQGIIKTANSRTVGVIVSWSQRGQLEYTLRDASGRLAAWPLIRPEGMDWIESPFIIHRSPGRFNQGHGYSGLWSALATLQDLTDLQSYEIQSAKKNAQTLAQVTQSDAEPAQDLAAELDPDAVAPIAGASDDGAASEAEPLPLDLDEMDAAGCVYDVMPPGVKMELLDTKHPNSNMPQFIQWLQGSSAWAKGLGAVYASGKADSSYTAAQAEMLLTQKTFDEEWHNLECGLLDWIIPHWHRWAVRTGRVRDMKLPAHWQRTCVKWQRPPKRAINPVDEQNALNSGLKNGTRLYREFYGPDWKAKLAEFAEEIDFCRARGIPHLALQTVSGAIINGNDKEGKQEGNHEDNINQG